MKLDGPTTKREVFMTNLQLLLLVIHRHRAINLRRGGTDTEAMEEVAAAIITEQQ